MFCSFNILRKFNFSASRGVKLSKCLHATMKVAPSQLVQFLRITLHSIRTLHLSCKLRTQEDFPSFLILLAFSLLIIYFVFFVFAITVFVCAYQGERNVRSSENLACFIFLKHPFCDSPFCLITDELLLFMILLFALNPQDSLAGATSTGCKSFWVSYLISLDQASSTMMDINPTWTRKS